MSERYELEADHLARGLTKPPTKFGIPMLAFYLNIMGCLFGWMLFQAITGATGLLSILAFVFLGAAIFVFMSVITFLDPFGLKLAWINLTEFRRNKTYSFWGNTDSYQP